MTEITINRTCVIVKRCERFTSGRVGARIKFSFSSEWAGLSKTAVFTNGDITIDVLNVADEITIPHEVLAISGKKLKVGVYGFTVGDNGSIEIAIPTVYAELGKVVKGADPSGDESTEPSLPVWAQIQSNVSDLDTRVTELEKQEQGGTSDHRQLTNRDAENQHSITAITGLQTALDGKQPSGDYATSGELDALADIVDGKADAADIPSLEGYATEAYVQNYHDNTKQDIITDLAIIRSGASKGATAVQPEAGKGLFSGDYDDLTNKPTIPTAYDDTEVRQRIGAIEAKESTWDAKSNFSGSYNDLTDKPAIPDAVTEGTVSDWGFTKNTGTYSKPTGGIPKADLAAAVQTSLGKADTALQTHQSLAAYRTAAAQDEIDSGKVDKENGKGLSTNDYTAAAKAKVDAIPANPKYTDTVYDDTALKERVATIEGKESAWDAKLNTSELPTAINTALAQAKASGEFDGADGYTPVKGVDYYTDADKTEMVNAVIAALPVYNGEVK